MDILEAKLGKLRHLSSISEGHVGDQILRYLFATDLPSRLIGNRCLLHPQLMEPHKFFLDGLLRSGDDGFFPDSTNDKKAAETLRLFGMINVSSIGCASFITPFHRYFYQVHILSSLMIILPMTLLSLFTDFAVLGLHSYRYDRGP